MRRLALAVLLCAAADTSVTRAQHAYRPENLRLALESVAAWALWAGLLAWPALRLGRRLGAPFAAGLAVLAGPIVLHQAIRTSLHATSGDGLDLGSWLGLAAALAGLAAVTVGTRQVERHFRTRWPGWGLAAAAMALLLPWGSASGTPAVSRAAPASPNLLLLVWDTTRADHLVPYGYDRGTTPKLDALARRGALFETCYSASIFTLSSHVSLLTGLPPSVHGTTMRRQHVTVPTLASRLGAAGYRTGAFVGTSVLAGSRGLERGFDVYDDRVDPPLCDTRLWALVHDAQALAARLAPGLFGGNGLPHWFQDFQRPAREVLASALEFIGRDDPRPWFALVNLFDVHWPYLPGEGARQALVRPYDGVLGGYLFRADSYPAGHIPDETDKRHVRDLYDAEMWELDQEVDRFLAALELDAGGTFVVMSADHGEGLGEQDLWSHDDLHAPQTRVPLLVVAPGRVEPGIRRAGPVSGLDVTPTLLALAGLPAPEGLAGVSLLTEGLPAERSIVIQDHDHLDPARDGDAVVRGRFKLLSAGGTRTLHDVIEDPHDLRDISADHTEVVAELGSILENLLSQSRESDGTVLDNEDALRALGYVGDS